MTRTGGNPVRARLVVAAVLGAWCLGLGVVPASAYWHAASGVPGSGAAAVGSLRRPDTPLAVASGGTVILTWTASTRADGDAVDRYSVQRYDRQGVASATGGSCSGTVVGVTCTDTGVPDGTWAYAVTPLFASWSGPPSTTSPVTLVDTTPPSLAPPVSTAVAGGSAQTGSTVWFRGAAAGSFALVSGVTDAGSGPAGAATSALGGVTTGWTHSPGRVSTPAGGPYTSNAFAWSAGTSQTATVTVTGYDAAGNASTPSTLSLVDDSTPPAGATLAVVTGAVTATSATLTLGTVTDVGSGVASRTLYERTAPLTGSTCGTFTAWSAVQAVTTTSVSRTLANQTCYDYQYVVVDRVGNAVTVSAPGLVKNRSYADAVTTTGGRLDQYRLNETSSATVNDSYTATSTNNGTCSGGPAPGRAGAITGDPDTAFGFDGVDDTCTVSRAVSGSFSIELWFKASGPGAGTDATWYSGAGLVGADVLGLPSDFGVTLLQDGRVCAGTGLLLSLCTTSTYLSGWHHVVFTRDASSGALVLYVDGVAKASGTGGLNLLAGSPSLRFGALKATGPFFTGTLDEIAVYTVVLPAPTVLQHYQTGTG